jgi:flagellar M-ring protein FliF
VNIDQLFTHFKKLAESLSAKQILGLVTVFIAVVGVVVGSAYWISVPQYTVLMSDMDSETASAVVAKLKTDKVQYQISDGGRTVSVPLERADELRMQFASGDLPSGGRIGFEIFDRTAFGTTEFLEHVNHQRALEGELGRTIASLSEVASARVHIAMAKDSLFVDEEQAAKASVVLKLKANRPLSAASIRGIAGLVSSSVESLRPESVVIIDDAGRQLNRQVDSAEAGASGLALDRQQAIERDLSTKVLALLEPVAGSGRVRVNVAAYLKADLVEETEERWDPNSVVRSRQTNTEVSASALAGGFGAGGVAGARANQPPALSTAPPAATPPAGAVAQTATGGAAGTAAPVAGAPVPGRSSETTNYEIGKVTRHTVSPQGQLARLSVAVILDDERVTTKAPDGTSQTTTKAWDAKKIEKVQAMVSAAVGLDTDRGDQLTVENIAFDTPVADDTLVEPGVTAQLTDAAKQYWPSALRGLAIFLIAMFAIFGVLKPLVSRAGTLAAAVTAVAPPLPALPAAPTTGRLPTVHEMQGQIEAELDAMTSNGESRRLPVLQQRIAKLATEEPDQVARIVRGWMAEPEK